MWADYINNMDMQDVGAELSAEVSAEEKLSIYQFCKEWEQDPGHVAFTQRLLNTKDVNSVDEIAKGNIVYDLMTGGIQPGPTGVKDPRNVKHDKMFRLAIDIINLNAPTRIQLLLSEPCAPRRRHSPVRRVHGQLRTT